MTEQKATVFDIQRNSYVDGPGIRTTVFFKGCNLHCAWCHNPESQDPAHQRLFYRNKCVGCGACREVCPTGLADCTACGACTAVCPAGARQLCGKEWTVEELMREIVKDRRFYEASGGGMTASGGECMLQIDALCALLRACRREGIHTAVDTAGHISDSYFERILPDTDLILYDLKCMDSDRHRRFTGVGNELILKNLRRLLATRVAVWVRVPIVVSVNATVEDMVAIRDFLRSCAHLPERVELLPYHAMGDHKYAALDITPTPFSAPDASLMSTLRAVFEG